MPLINCPHCGLRLNVPDEQMTRNVVCARCKGTFAPSVEPRLEAGSAETPPSPAVTLPYAPAKGTSGMAVASLVLGIVSVSILSLICGILAVVFAGRARAEIAAGRASPGSLGMAKAGRICGWVGIGLSIGFWVLLMLFFAGTFLISSGF